MLLHYLLQGLFVLVGLVALLAAVFNWDWLFTARNSRFVVTSVGRRKARLLYAVLGAFMVGTGLFFALCLLSACGREEASAPSVTSCPLGEECRQAFQKARKLQRDRKFPEAIEGYRACIAFDSTDPAEAHDLFPTVDEALLQLMNTYQSAGLSDECADTLTTLCQRPTSLMQRYLRSDSYSLLGYALSRTERMDEAEQWTDSALAVPQYQPTPQRVFRKYAYAAAVFFCNPNRQEEVIEYCEKALEQANEHPNVAGGGFVASMLGTLYKQTGRVNEAIHLFMHSIDKCQEHKDTLSYISICQSMADLYLYWDLPKYAQLYATYAIQAQEHFSAIGPMIKAQSFFLKGQSFVNRPDSALHYFRLGENVCKALPYNAGQVDADRLIGQWMVSYSHHPDSLRQGMDLLHNVTLRGTSKNRANAYFQLAKGHQRLNDPAREQEAMLDSMYSLLHAAPSPLFIKEANKFALEHFLQTDQDREVRRYAAALLWEQRQSNEALPSQKMADDIVHLVNRQREQELQLQQEMMKRREQGVIFLLGSSFITIVLLIILFRRKFRIQELERQALETRLNALIEKVERERSLQSAAQGTPAVSPSTTDLHDSPSATPSAARSSRPPLSEATIPSVFKTEGESSFRSRFTQLYPNFLFNLRRHIPTINPREELLCMLIVLEQDIDQTSSILGIARTSVTQARYRLRNKMRLERNDSLDTVIKALVNEKA